MEIVVDGKMRECTDLGPVEINLEANATIEVASTAEAETFP